MYDTRALDTSIEGIRLVRTVVLSGPLSWLWKYKVSKDIFYKTSIELESLAFYARRVQYLNQLSLDHLMERLIQDKYRRFAMKKYGIFKKNTRTANLNGSLLLIQGGQLL